MNERHRCCSRILRRVSEMRQGDGHPITDERLQKVHLRLVDASQELDPKRLPTVPEILDRVRAVALELQEIEQDLRVVMHVAQIEERGGYENELVGLEVRVAQGEEIAGRDADEVVDDLRARFGA
jgi:hypothetical protein